MKRSHWVKIKPSRVHARVRGAERHVPIPEGIDMFDGTAYWNDARIDERGDVCIDLWLPYGTKGMYRGYPLAFKDKHFAVSKTAMHGRARHRVENKMSKDIMTFKLIVDYLGL